MFNAIVGGIGGSILTVIVSIVLFFKQFQSETNRLYLKSMFDIMKDMYLHIQKNKQIPTELSYELTSLKVIGLKKFEKLKTTIDEINELVDGYNEYIKALLESTTTPTPRQKGKRDDLEKKLKEATKKMYKLT
jgi:hypothetical protein